MHCLWDGGPAPLHIFPSPQGFRGTDGNQHPPGVFKAWTKAQLRAVGAYDFTPADRPREGEEVVSKSYIETAGTVVETATMQDRPADLSDLKRAFEDRADAQLVREMRKRRVYDGVDFKPDPMDRGILAGYAAVAAADPTFTVTIRDAKRNPVPFTATSFLSFHRAIVDRAAELHAAHAAHVNAIKGAVSVPGLRSLTPFQWPP